MSTRGSDSGASGTAGGARSRQLTPDAAVAVRLALADDADGDAIRRLASLAGSAPPDGPRLAGRVWTATRWPHSTSPTAAPSLTPPDPIRR
jgi:hypothetical protein